MYVPLVHAGTRVSYLQNCTALLMGLPRTLTAAAVQEHVGETIREQLPDKITHRAMQDIHPQAGSQHHQWVWSQLLADVSTL
jgi:hypothetical protein